MLELNKSNFEKEIKESKIVVIDFWADWCMPCKMSSPTFAELSKEMKNIIFAKVDVDENPEIASRLGVMSIPTFIIFKNSKEVDRIIGTNAKSTLKAKIEAATKN